MEETLFRHRKLTDYEKLLFAQKELSDARVELGKSQSYISELEDMGSAKDRKIQSLESKLADLKKKQTDWHTSIKESNIYKDLLQKFKNLERTVSRLRNDNRDLITKKLHQ